MNDLDPRITFTHAASGERLVVEALPLGQDGRYRAEVRLPLAGEWSWSIQAFTMDMELPALTADAAQKLGYRNVASLIGGYKALVMANWPMKTGA